MNINMENLSKNYLQKESSFVDSSCTVDNSVFLAQGLDSLIYICLHKYVRNSFIFNTQILSIQYTI